MNESNQQSALRILEGIRAILEEKRVNSAEMVRLVPENRYAEGLRDGYTSAVILLENTIKDLQPKPITFKAYGDTLHIDLSNPVAKDGPDFSEQIANLEALYHGIGLDPITDMPVQNPQPAGKPKMTPYQARILELLRETGGYILHISGSRAYPQGGYWVMAGKQQWKMREKTFMDLVPYLYQKLGVLNKWYPYKYQGGDSHGKE